MLDVKDAFLAQDALVVVVSLVAQPLTQHAEGLMTKRDTLIVQLVITFLRNLIIIPDSDSRSGVMPLPILSQRHAHMLRVATTTYPAIALLPCSFERQPQEQDQQHAALSLDGRQRSGATPHHGAARVPRGFLPLSWWSPSARNGMHPGPVRGLYLIRY